MTLGSICLNNISLKIPSCALVLDMCSSSSFDSAFHFKRNKRTEDKDGPKELAWTQKYYFAGNIFYCGPLFSEYFWPFNYERWQQRIDSFGSSLKAQIDYIYIIEKMYYFKFDNFHQVVTLPGAAILVSSGKISIRWPWWQNISQKGEKISRWSKYLISTLPSSWVL